MVGDRDSRWRRTIVVPIPGELNAGRAAFVFSVSCASAGNCAASGGYRDGSGHPQAFVVNDRNGRWGTAIEIPGTAALNKGGQAVTSAVSRPSAGNCAAGGLYRDGSGHRQVFVVSEGNGHWGKAIEVPGSGALNAGGNARISSVSCGQAGNCAAGGSYRDRSGHFQGFIVRQT